MRAVRFDCGKPVVVDLPPPRPPAGEALIRVSLAGICGTDLEIARGYMQFDGVPGHEFVGVVERADLPEWIGRRVVGEINAGCGACERCHGGLGRHCHRRTVLGIRGRDGALAERLTLPLANLHPVPDTVADRTAVFTEPLAAALEILEQIQPAPETRAVVLGDGRLGQLCAEVLALAGTPPVVCGHHPEKLARLERRGLRTARSPDELHEEFDLAVEATGSPDGLRTALRIVRPRGTVVLKSTYHGEAPLALAGLVIDEIELVGSRCGPFDPALQRLTTNPGMVEGMISAVYSLDDAASAFEHASRGDALKVLLAP